MFVAFKELSRNTWLTLPEGLCPVFLRLYLTKLEAPSSQVLF